jgi:hypothetical protein
LYGVFLSRQSVPCFQLLSPICPSDVYGALTPVQMASGYASMISGPTLDNLSFLALHIHTDGEKDDRLVYNLVVQTRFSSGMHSDLERRNELESPRSQRRNGGTRLPTLLLQQHPSGFRPETKNCGMTKVIDVLSLRYVENV